MEGYLTLVTTKFTGTKFRRVWVVLDRQQLTWYDHIDLSDQTPKKLKGMMFIRNAKVQKANEPPAMLHCLIIECESVKTTFCCPDPDTCNKWYLAVTKSAKWHEEQAKKDALPVQYLAHLGLHPDEKLSKALLARTYKKLSLRAHPDKGGDPDVFNKIKEAYNYLVAIQTHRDELDGTEALQFEATLRKQSGKIGLGLSVTEDRLSERLLVSKVQDAIHIVDISEEAEGAIKVGDRIIGIDNDDCSHWSMPRVIARLGLVRVRVGDEVVFTFERRVPIDSSSVDDSESETATPVTASTEPSPAPSTIFQRNKSITPTPRTQPSEGSGSATPKSPSSNNSINGNNEAADREVPEAKPVPKAGASADAQHAADTATPNAAAVETSAAAPTAPEVPISDPPQDEAPVWSPAEARAAARERLRQRALAASASAALEPAVVLPAPAPVFVPLPPPDSEAATVGDAPLHHQPALAQEASVPPPPPPAAPAHIAVGEEASSATWSSAKLAQPGSPLPAPHARSLHLQTQSPRGHLYMGDRERTTAHTAHRSPSPPLAVTTRPVYAPPAPSLPVPKKDDHRPPPPQTERGQIDTSRPDHAIPVSLGESVPTRRFGRWTAGDALAHEPQHSDQDLPERFQRALRKQQEAFAKQLESVESELRQSVQTVRERDASIRALSAENDALKDTVASLARCVESKTLESDERRSDYISGLHRTITELRAQVRLQADALKLFRSRPPVEDSKRRTAAGATDAHGELQTTPVSVPARYRETEEQAARLETMLLHALQQADTVQLQR